MNLRTCRVGTCDRIIGWNEDRCAEHRSAVGAGGILTEELRQPSLFDAPRAGDYRASDPLPSRHAAAASLTARQAQKREIVRALSSGPATAFDLRWITEGQQNRVSKRLGEMVRDGLVRACGITKGPHGRDLTLYRLTEDGMRDAALLGVAS